MQSIPFRREPQNSRTRHLAIRNPCGDIDVDYNATIGSSLVLLHVYANLSVSPSSKRDKGVSNSSNLESIFSSRFVLLG